jgi:hypothetical protein
MQPRMGFLDKLFGKKPASPLPTAVAEMLSAPPRLVSEAPEFPDAPIVLRRDVSAADAERALSQAGFVRGDGDRWTRDGAIVERRTEPNGNLHVLVFSGEAIREAQRAVLPTVAWVDPNAGLYDQLRDNRIAAPDLCYLLWATRHYRCVGGVPAELRRHADAEVTETIRLIDRAQMADAARARRNR